MTSSAIYQRVIVLLTDGEQVLWRFNRRHQAATIVKADGIQIVAVRFNAVSSATLNGKRRCRRQQHAYLGTDLDVMVAHLDGSLCDLLQALYRHRRSPLLSRRHHRLHQHHLRQSQHRRRRHHPRRRCLRRQSRLVIQ